MMPLEALAAHNLHLPLLVANSLLDKRAAVRVTPGAPDVSPEL